MSQSRLLPLLATTNKYWFCGSKMGEILRVFFRGGVETPVRLPVYAAQEKRRRGWVQFAWKVLALGRI